MDINIYWKLETLLISKLIYTEQIRYNRAEAAKKAARDKEGFKCKICMTTFMINVKPPTLYLHMTSKHPGTTDCGLCFDSMKGYDPNAPTESTKAAAPVAAKKKTKKQEESLDDLLSAGLSLGKSKKKAGKKK